MQALNILAVSDTHNRHANLPVVPNIDLFIHAGDISVDGTKEEILSFVKWINRLPYPNKVFIAGNHDVYLDGVGRQRIRRMLDKSVIYLEDEAEEILGLKVYGSPSVARNGSPAFARERGNALRSVWRHIPADTELLVTHMPAAGILDVNARNESCGCDHLLNKIMSLKNLKAHVAGHIHGGRGSTVINGVQFHNVAYLQKVTNELTVFQL